MPLVWFYRVIVAYFSISSTVLYLFYAFYRAMLRRARLCHSKSSVRLSVSLRYDFHTGCNTSKTISRPNSLRLLLGLTATWAIWCNGNTPKIRVDRGGVTQEHKKNLQYLRNGARWDQGYYDGLIGIAYALSIATKINDLG